MDINTASGEQVVFVGTGGWPGEVAAASAYLIVGNSYTVKSLDVGQSSSTVTLEEFPMRRFNTVMFKNNALSWKRYDWFRELCYIGFGDPHTQEDFATMPFDEGHIYEELLKDRPTKEEVPGVPEVKFSSVKNVLVTARRYSDQQLTILNPKDDQEVIDLFMEKYGYEPFSMNKMWFDKSFDPADHFGRSCSCD